MKTAPIINSLSRKIAKTMHTMQIHVSKTSSESAQAAQVPATTSSRYHDAAE